MDQTELEAPSTFLDRLFLQQDPEHPAERFGGAPEELVADGEGGQELCVIILVTKGDVMARTNAL